MNKAMLDEVAEKLQTNEVCAGMAQLFNGLQDLRLSNQADVWQKMVETDLRPHVLAELLQLDPMTHRSFLKPRGYAGDAVLLDMVYGHPAFSKKNVPGLGREIYEYIFAGQAGRAVRYRRHIIADAIDDVASRKTRPCVMSLACGHLREAELSEALQGGHLGRFLALDQDERSLQIVHHNYSQLGVSAKHISVRDILKKKLRSERFDLIYSSGLYDYLPLKTAKVLTRRLFDLLHTEGRLLITNFLPAIEAIGYMECFMDWYLIHRDEVEMMALVADIPRNLIKRIELFVEKQENIVFLQIQKDGSAIRK